MKLGDRWSESTRQEGWLKNVLLLLQEEEEKKAEGK
jgi:hypothetical protein